MTDEERSKYFLEDVFKNSRFNQVMDENPTAKEQYLSGKTNILDFLVGQVMKKTRGKANPASTRSILQELIQN